jgi:GxxExxY protein
MDEKERLNQLSAEVIKAAIQVHKQLGPGLLESAYEACLRYELGKQGIPVRTQVELPVIYDEIKLDIGFRLDLLVTDSIVVELKAVDKVTPVHEAQLLTYLKLGNFKLGLLINFNVTLLKDGIKRMVNNL